MTRFLTMPLAAGFCAAMLATGVPAPAEAGKIARACMSSDRPAATRARCNCIQKVADDALNRSEQRRIAKWFSDPHQAQVVRMSSRASDEALWERYKAFGQLAKAVCQ
ncbi:hypothetical protein ACFORG_09165 [Lutimaribacter marinistellae]|uniref:Secreted protein n=1 Tax=Lutimaribacter marinistellae TaxID=1820329 RepID=A0ABV7TGS6_9RHOB